MFFLDGLFCSSEILLPENVEVPHCPPTPYFFGILGTPQYNILVIDSRLPLEARAYCTSA